MTEARKREYCEIAEKLVPHAFRTRGWRRRFVVLGNVLAVATVGSALLDLGAFTVLLGIGAGLSCAMFFGAVLVPEGVMNQEEAQLRDRSHRQSFTFASYVLFPVALVVAALMAEQDMTQIAWAFVAGCLVFWGLPYTIVAWGLSEDYATANLEPASLRTGGSERPVSAAQR